MTACLPTPALPDSGACPTPALPDSRRSPRRPGTPATPRRSPDRGTPSEEGDVEGAAEHLRRALAAWENADEDFEPARRARAKLAEPGG